MASRRMIASDIFEDEFFCELSHIERLLWIGIIAQCADDQGRLQDRPKMINSRVFPNDEISVSEIEKGLELFAKKGKITRYEGDGKKLIQINKWWVYQTPAWAAPSKFQAPDNWVDRIKIHVTGNKVRNENWDKPGGYIYLYEEVYVQPVSYPISYPIEDVNVNVNDDGNYEDEGDGHNPAATAINIFQLFEDEIGSLTPLISDTLQDWEKEYSPEWVADAIKEAVLHNARNQKYIDKILKNRKAGITLQKAKNSEKSKDYYLKGEYSEFLSAGSEER